MDVVRLLTLLNASAARPSAMKRKRADDSACDDWLVAARRAKSSTSEFSDTSSHGTGNEASSKEADEDEFLARFGPESQLLNDASIAGVDASRWQTSALEAASLGKGQQTRLHGGAPALPLAKRVPKLVTQMEKHGRRTLEQVMFGERLATYEDILFDPAILGGRHDSVVSELASHAMSHIHKGQRIVLANNDLLARAASADIGEAPDRDMRDQGFTRPKVLILTPFRNNVLTWITHLMRVSPSNQIENERRLRAEYALPTGVIDRLAEPDARQRFPADHIDTFGGNIDDSFRLGIKVSRKSLKLFSEFYASDIIIASPLGLRKSIDADGGSDYLSSIELVIVDRAHVLLMQNWEHVQFVLSKLNQIPADAHGCDFARVKPWYLDNKAPYLRQTVVSAAFETPEIRALFHRQSRNVSGRSVLMESRPPAALTLPAGVRQTFVRFEAAAQEHDDARFEAFTTMVLPALLKSAVMSSHTLIFVPSYFDFVRLRAHMKTLTDLDVAAISEYSVNADVTRARAFFKSGRKSFLLVTERFHFYRRYRLQGAKTVVFYALPDHATYYSELITQAVADAGDGADTSVQALFSGMDALKIGRTLGEENARRLCAASQGSGRFTFTA